MVTYETGAKRGDLKPMYQLIPLAGLRRLAETLTEGHLKYDPSLFVQNWKLGNVDFFGGCFDHALEHLYKFRAGETDEDHLGHAAANIFFLIWAQEEGIFDPANPPVEEVPVEETQDAVADPSVTKRLLNLLGI